MEAYARRADDYIPAAPRDGRCHGVPNNREDERMDQTWTTAKLEQALKQLYTRAATDPAFRARCLQDAPGAVKEISGIELTDVRVRFVEKLEEQVLVLPALVASGELHEQELENVAGGAGDCRWTAARGTGGSRSTTAAQARSGRGCA